MKKYASKWLSRKTIIPILGPALALLGIYKIISDLGWDGPIGIPYSLALLLIAWNSVGTIKEFHAQKKTLNS